MNKSEKFKEGANEKSQTLPNPLVELLLNLRNSLRSELHPEKDERDSLPQFRISIDKK